MQLKTRSAVMNFSNIKHERALLNIHGQLQHELRSFTAFRHLPCINNTELLSATEMSVLNYNLYSC